jgi:transcriptional regulator with XRE-family HTH domain
MDTPGSALKTEREKQNKSLTAIEKILNIQIEYLEAIEKDDYAALPPEVYVKAYLRLYADTLGIDHNYILKLYSIQRKTHQTKHSGRHTQFEKSSFSSLKQLFPGKLTSKIIATSLILIVLLVVVIYYVTYTKREASVIAVQPKQIPGAVEKPAELSLDITALSLTWVSVRADNAKPKEWLLRSGETIALSAHDTFVIKVGNAGGTKLTLNGRDVGVLGPHGKVVDIVLP